ncbi:hypothetical protein ONZ45_g14509 [Pleurotus djamor]|nr:hypothetical protein ONZ45_g14509 [Pleurotus djamor]
MAHTNVQHTPVRAHKPYPTTRDQMEPPAEGLIPSDAFAKARLNRPAKKLRPAFAALLENVKIIRAVGAFQRETGTSYKLGVDVINAALRAVYGEYLDFASKKDELVCIDVNERNLRYHPHQHFLSRADFVIIPKSVALQLKKEKLDPAYHHIVSAGELKRAKDNSKGPKQCMTYLGLASQALPHRVSLLGFSLSPRGYNLHWSSPSGVDCSEEYDWENLTPLLEFAYTLYCPPKAKLHQIFDNTISLSKGLSVRDPPKWDVKVGKYTYKRCEVRMVGQPWHRMSWIAETPKGFIIKDQYRSDCSTFTEGELYDTLHEAGYALGLLRVMFDVLEAHRHAVRHNVLHRDLSMANILIYPKTVSGTPEVEPFTGAKRPRFIKEVLDKKKLGQPEALIIDLDNACKCDRGEEHNPDPLHERTGTPKYIARSVSLGMILHLNSRFIPMPELPRELAECYESAYADAGDPLRTFKDSNGTTHGGRIDPDKADRYDFNVEDCRTDFEHRPRHDAESVFWCILAFLMRALPKETDGEESEADINKEKFQKQWESFRDHEIPDKSFLRDSRTDLLGGVVWSQVLHHKLAFVAPLIKDLIFQIRPEYTLLEPTPDPFHLHEAMQRILFKYMVLWKNEDVEFNTEEQRKIPVKENGKQETGEPALDGQLASISVPTCSKRTADIAQLEQRPLTPESEGGSGEETETSFDHNAHKPIMTPPF